MTANLDGLRVELSRWAVNVHGEALAALPDLVRPDAPVSKPNPLSTGTPGALRDSIRSEQTGFRGDAVSGVIYSDLIQALTTDRGARPHVIRPRRPGGRLVFWWDNGPRGAGVYAFPFVNHPGNPPMNWWTPSIERNWPRALQEAAARNGLGSAA